MEIKINLTTNEQKDLKSYCKLNELDETEIVKKSYLEGFKIEKYGLLGNTGGVQEKQVVKEVIVEKRVEIPVEVIKEVVKIEYVEVPVDRVVEKIVEITKEVPVEVVVTKTEYVSDDSQINELLLKIQQLESDKQLFSTKTEELEGEVLKFSTITTENENIFQNEKQNEKNELLLKIQQLENKPPEVIETIKEVIVEKQTTNNSLKPKMDALQNTVQKLKLDNIEKDKKIKELESAITDIQKFQENKPAVYLKGSNLDNKLYK
jgi:hypothetical protein